MILNGSDKQNEWAKKIEAEWRAELEREIAETVLRNDDLLAWYVDALKAASAKLEAGLAKITAKQAIDYHVAKRSPSFDLIKAAQKKK